MNLAKVTILVGLLSLGVVTKGANAQAAARDRVTVSCTCDDTMGKAYAAALHQALAKSSHYREVGVNEGVEKNAIRISIVSMPLEPAADGQPNRSALSIVCLHDGAIMHQFVETCTKVPIKDCAEAMLEDLLNWA